MGLGVASLLLPGAFHGSACDWIGTVDCEYRDPYLSALITVLIYVRKLERRPAPLLPFGPAAPYYCSCAVCDSGEGSFP